MIFKNAIAVEEQKIYDFRRILYNLVQYWEGEDVMKGKFLERINDLICNLEVVMSTLIN